MSLFHEGGDEHMVRRAIPDWHEEFRGRSRQVLGALHDAIPLCRTERNVYQSVVRATDILPIVSLLTTCLYPRPPPVYLLFLSVISTFTYGWHEAR